MEKLIEYLKDLYMENKLNKKSPTYMGLLEELIDLEEKNSRINRDW